MVGHLAEEDVRTQDCACGLRRLQTGSSSILPSAVELCFPTRLQRRGNPHSPARRTILSSNLFDPAC